ncbi:MAG TPA: hypothetical protein VFR67_31255 [Pilimelia sp.]|nr:hypothetical protein [Pilimelia sp.]
MSTPEGITVDVADPPAAGPPAIGPPAASARWRARLDTALRVTGGLVAVVGTVVTALAEIFYVPLRVGGVLVGASVVLAVVANVVLVRFTVATTGTKAAALVPPLIWFGMMMVASNRQVEGDILLAGDNWVGLATIFAGSLAFGVAGYRLILAR